MFLCDIYYFNKFISFSNELRRGIGTWETLFNLKFYYWSSRQYASIYWSWLLNLCCWAISYLFKSSTNYDSYGWGVIGVIGVVEVIDCFYFSIFSLSYIFYFCSLLIEVSRFLFCEITLIISFLIISNSYFKSLLDVSKHAYDYSKSSVWIVWFFFEHFFLPSS